MDVRDKQILRLAVAILLELQHKAEAEAIANVVKHHARTEGKDQGHA